MGFGLEFIVWVLTTLIDEVFWIYIALTVCYAEHLFTGLLASDLFPLQQSLFRSFP